MKKSFHNFLVISYETLQMIIFSLPRYRTLNYIKKVFLQLNGAKIGRRVIFYPGVFICPGSNLKVGDDVDFARGVLVLSPGGVDIGDRVLIGFGCQIITGNHKIPEGHGRIFDGGHNRAPVVIEKDSWLGANVVVLPGVTVGEGAVVAAGSIVNKDVPPFTVVAGVPAKVIKQRS